MKQTIQITYNNIVFDCTIERTIPSAHTTIQIVDTTFDVVIMSMEFMSHMHPDFEFEVFKNHCIHFVKEYCLYSKQTK